MHITVITIGSRGDVQPIVALSLGLQQAGHQVRVVTTDDFGAFVRSRGLDFYPLGLDMRELMGTQTGQQIMTSEGKFLRAIRQMIGMMRAVAPELLEGIWQASQGTEALVYSTLGVVAYHIAEKLNVPCFWALTCPIFSRTRTIPSIVFPPLPLGGVYNLLTHVLVEQFAHQLTVRFINRFRRQRLDLPPLPPFGWPYGESDGKPVPLLYSYSSAVFPKPPDWGGHIHAAGYWLLDPLPDWRPPADLVDFLDSGPPPVYIGFGSMSNRDPEKTTQIVLGALRRSGQRGLIATGLGGLTRTDLPDDVFMLESIPHGWLFPRVAAVVHHGGAGTTGAGLLAGVPSVIVPHFADQLFWARRIAALGVGPPPIPHTALTAERLGQAIATAVTDLSIRDCLATLSAHLRAEDGVARAVDIIDRGLAAT